MTLPEPRRPLPPLRLLRTPGRTAAATAIPLAHGDDTAGVKSDAPLTIALGVLLDGEIQEAWVAASLRQALAVPGVRLAAVAVTRGNGRVTLPSRLHRLLDRFDTRIRCRNEQLFAPTDIAAEFGVPLFKVEIAHRADGWDPTRTGVTTLRRCRAQLWLCFTAAPPRRPLDFVSRYGVWGLEIGDGVPATCSWAGAIEIGAGSPVTMVSAVDYAQPVDCVLYRSFGATVPNSISRNRLGCLHKGLTFFRRLLERLTHEGDDWRLALPAAPAAPARYPKLRKPTFSALFQVSRRLVSRVAANHLFLRTRLDQWQIAYYFADEDEAAFRPERLLYLVPPKDRLWADPMAIERAGRYFIFFEELFFATGRGRILAIEVFENGPPGEPQVVLERPYHLSYPFLFEWEGSLFMLPETAENGTVEVYRCEEFPLRWRLHQVLIDNVRAYDATLWRDRDRWWMFVTLAEPGADSCDELHLYWSATPLGPWTAHRGNPVISDARRARSAGPLFVRNGTLYRPSQECSITYGHSLLINRVDVLNDEEYRETTVRRIAPDWREDLLRVHTWGAAGRLRVVDYGVSRKRRP
jgi:hypothetical protein